jgi:hypothetical protein
MEAGDCLLRRNQLARLRDAIAIGDEQSARDQVVPWTPAFLERLKRQSTEKVRNGDPCQDEAIP